MKCSCYFKILHFINRNKKNVEYLFLQNNRHKTELIADDKSVRIEKKGAVAGYFYYPETFCLNCKLLCPAKACSVSQIDQSKIDRMFLSYVYTKMEDIHIARNEAYGHQK